MGFWGLVQHCTNATAILNSNYNNMTHEGLSPGILATGQVDRPSSERPTVVIDNTLKQNVHFPLHIWAPAGYARWSVLRYPRFKPEIVMMMMMMGIEYAWVPSDDSYG